VIVTLHLLGGMATFALIVWLAARDRDPPRGLDLNDAMRLRPWALLALLVVSVQIALGGWVSSNYAALACIDFPTCHGEWVPQMDFRHGFQVVRDLGKTATGTHLAYEALTAIHWTHRAGALVTFLFLGVVALMLAKVRGAGFHAALLGALLLAQISLGIANVLAGLPLAVAVAHNAVAALLLASLVLINCALFRVTPFRQS
jgi:cytochrome c oxidase assembly protein subunit 15